MNVLINLGVDPGIAAQFLKNLGAYSDSLVLQKDDLRPRKVLSTLSQLRKLRADVLYILVHDVSRQYNLFYLSCVALMSGATSKMLCDHRDRMVHLTLRRFLSHNVPQFCAAAIYATIVYFALVWLWLLVFVLAKAGRGQATRVRGPVKLSYLKTDFWFALGAGGSVTHTKEFINAGARAGYDVEVFSADPLSEYELDVPVTIIEPSRLLWQISAKASKIEYNFRFCYRVWQALRTRKPSALYQRISQQDFCGSILSVLLNVPLLLEVNNSMSWAAKNWSKSESHLVDTLCEKINIYAASKVAVISDVLKKSLVTSGVPSHKIIVNPNGVDPAKFDSRLECRIGCEQFPDKRHFVGFIGIFGQWHGVLTLASCVKHVVARRSDVQFAIIGDGQLKDKMVNILESDGVRDSVWFAGVVNHAQAPKYLSICDVLVSPHEDMEDGSAFFGSPTKIFEYMAMGKGIVASRVGQLGEILEDGVDAILVEQKNPLALADAILKFIENPELRLKMGRAARDKVSSRYTWEQNFRRVVSHIG